MKRIQDWYDERPEGANRYVTIRCLSGSWHVVLDEGFSGRFRSGYGSADNLEDAWKQALETFK